MARKNASKSSSTRQRTSIGTLLITLLLVLAYWWMTGTLPNGDPAAVVPVANEPAPATATTALPTGAEAPGVAEVATAHDTEQTVAPTVDNQADNQADNSVAESESTESADAESTDSESVVAPTNGGESLDSEPSEGESVDAEEAPADAATATNASTPTTEPTATPLPTATATTPPPATETPANPPRAGPAGIPAINYDELPREALETLILIGEGGPFPFDRDGITFQNREGILPDKPRGYYSEYTVITPGASTRGARRIVAGEDGEFYYTDDHYESFSWIVLP